MVIKITPEFEKEAEKLCKKYRHIHDDIERFKSVLGIVDAQNGDGSVAIVQAIRYSNLGDAIKCPVYKAEKFRSSDFKKSDKFRLIYAYSRKKDTFLLIRIYGKMDYEKSIEENHNRAVILKYCQTDDF